MTDKLDIRIDSVPDDQISRAIACIRDYGHRYPDRCGVREGAIYAEVTGPAPQLFVYRTKAGRLVCRLLREKDND